MSETSQEPEVQETENDQRLRYVDMLEYERHTIKLVRRGNIIKALTYAPSELLASHILGACKGTTYAELEPHAINARSTRCAHRRPVLRD